MSGIPSFVGTQFSDGTEQDTAATIIKQIGGHNSVLNSKFDSLSYAGWFVNQGGGTQTPTLSLITGAGSPVGDAFGDYALQWSMAADANKNYNVLCGPAIGTQYKTGLKITYSFWARLISGAGAWQLNFLNPSGLDGLGINYQQFTATTAWQRFTFTGTITTDAASDTAWYLAPMDKNAAATIQFTGFQIEIGDTATAYAPAPLPDTYALQAQLAMRAQWAITASGAVTYDSSGNFGWANRLIVIPLGNGNDTSAAGYFVLTQPTSGAISVAGGAGARNWSAAGIPMTSWDALWYKLPRGSGASTVNGNFLITSFSSAMEPPSTDYILVASRNSDSGLLRVSTGHVLKAGASVPISAIGGAPWYDDSGQLYSPGNPPPAPAYSVDDSRYRRQFLFMGA